MAWLWAYDNHQGILTEDVYRLIFDWIHIYIAWSKSLACFQSQGLRVLFLQVKWIYLNSHFNPWAFMSFAFFYFELISPKHHNGGFMNFVWSFIEWTLADWQWLHKAILSQLTKSFPKPVKMFLLYTIFCWKHPVNVIAMMCSVVWNDWCGLMWSVEYCWMNGIRMMWRE